MKKITILFLLFIMLFITGCDLINQMTCEHELSITEETASTCSVQGIIVSECSKCSYKKTEKKPLLPHEYVQTQVKEADCNNDGYTLQICEICNHEEKTNIIPKLGHNFSDWEIIKEATDFNEGLKQRVCNICGYLEKQVIISGEYIDMDIVKYDFSNKNNYTVKSYEQLELLFNSALLNNAEKLECTIEYEISDFNALLKKLVNNSRISLSYQVGAQMLGKKLTFTITYETIAAKSTTNTVYTQYSSSNYQKYSSNRKEDFDDFKINSSHYSYNVSSSEQLVYILQRQVKPVCEKGSKAETIYNEMKKILIEIVDDNMNDVEKIKAIYEWLILNITYDDELLQFVSQNQNVKEYNGFYLEGSILDKKAVCEGIAKALASLANIEGIPCVIVEGYQVSNPNGVGHAWNKVNIDGKWYIIDATSGGIVVDNKYEVLSYQYFLISENTMNLKYKSDKFIELVCKEDYEYFKNFNYINNDVKKDFIIETQEELNDLIKFFETNNNKNKTIEFKVTFDFGSSIHDEIQKAYSKLNVSTQYSVIVNNNTIILVN